MSYLVNDCSLVDTTHHLVHVTEPYTSAAADILLAPGEKFTLGELINPFDAHCCHMGTVQL